MKNKLKILSDYLTILLGTAIIALGINVLLVPMKISIGGISGIGTVLVYLFNIPMSVTNLVANAILFILGVRVLSKSSILKTVFGILSLSGMLELATYISFPEIDMLMAAIFGGVIVGFGIGLIIIKDASTGGSDFVALMLKRILPQIPTALALFCMDLAVVVTMGIVFGDFLITLYSIVSIFICSKTVDLVLVKGEKSKIVYIISGKKDDISAHVLRKMERGLTEFYAKGAYSGEDRGVLMCVCRSRELPELMRAIKEVDPGAFVVITAAKRVVGEGFDKS